MKKVLFTLIPVFLVLSFCITANAGEYYGITYNRKDEIKALEIKNQIKKGKEVVIDTRKNKRSLNIAVAFLCDNFELMNMDDVVIEYGVLYGNKYYSEFEFPTKKKYKKLIKKEKKLERKRDKELKALKKWEKTIANNCRKYNSQQEQFYALEKYMVENMQYKNEGDLHDKYIYLMNASSTGNPYIVYLTNHGICSDFSQVVDDICEELNIPCHIVLNETHAWNMVVLDGVVYQVDVTWDICNKAIIYGPDCDKEKFEKEHTVIDIVE